MPEKSVQEMSQRERRRHSLAARTFHAVIAMAAVLGAVALIIGGYMYVRAVNGQYIITAYNVSAGASAIINRMADPADAIEQVMTKFREIPEEELETQDTMAYQDKFRYLKNDENYQQILAILRFLKDNNEVDDVYLSYYDEETMRMVYIVDPEDRSELRCPPGTWEPVDQHEMDVFLHPKDNKTPYIFTNEKFGWLCTSGVPIKGSDGSIVGFVQADISVVDLIKHIWHFLLQFALVLLAVTLILAYLFVRYFEKTLVNPVNRIAAAAETYVQDRRAGAGVDDHFSRQVLHITTGDEVENLSLVMSNMERDLNEYEVDLTRITAEKERIGTELALATRIQADMLPNIFPAFPERQEFDIYASMTPAKEVGGDFYDFFLVDDDHLALVMADVAGKGIPAALFMMVSKILVQNYTLNGESPGKVLAAVNDRICQNNREEMFVTVWLGILELSTGRLTASNAGHEFPVIGRRGKEFELYKDKHGFVVGAMEAMRYQDYEITLAPGDKIFVYTDGVVEATNGKGEMFGTARMLAALNEKPDASPDRILLGIHAAVDDFVREAPRFDDLTMLCLEYQGPAKESPET